MIEVKIITPSKVELKAQAYMVTMPAETGEMGVLEGHSNMVVTLTAGTVSIYSNERDITDQFQISEGFAEVSSEAVVLLVESASKC